MINDVELSDKQIKDIKELASETREKFGVFGDVPIGSDIKMLVEKKGILLCEYPFSDNSETHTYGNITWFRTEDETITFIGLNTASYYDEQIFALAHEIYHYTTHTGKAYSKEEDEDKLTEKKADRFAAELLITERALNKLVKENFGCSDLSGISNLKLLRFVARIQCEWWLPYQAIVNRLFEENYINSEKLGLLYNIDCRSDDGVYIRILKSTDRDIAELLNRKTRAKGVSNKILEATISNYEEGFIDDDEFVKLLKLFDKTPEDFGIEIVGELDDELKEFFESEDGE